MRRKIILHGPSSLTISLPAEWVKRKKLKKGDEVDISENDKGLVVNPVIENNHIKKAEISLIGLDDNTWKDILLTLHKKGYDEINLNYEDPIIAKKLSIILNELNLGFEVINQSHNNITIGSIANPASEQFNNLFRRTFRIAIEYSRKIQAIIKKGEEITDSCFSYKTSINRITKISKRIVIKENKSHTPFTFSIISHLEVIGNILSKIEVEIKERKQKISGEPLDVFDEIVNLLTKTYDLYYNFSFKKYEVLRNNSRQLGSRIKKIKREDELLFCYLEHLENMHKIIDVMLKSILAINI